MERELSETNKQILELHSQGILYREIARQLGLTENSVRHRISRMRKNGIPLNGLREESSRLNERIIELYYQELTNTQIAEVLDIEPEIVRDRIHKLKVRGKIEEIEFRNPNREKQNEIIVILFNQGCTNDEISKAVGLSIHAIKKRINFLRENTSLLSTTIRDRRNVQKRRREREAKIKERERRSRMKGSIEGTRKRGAKKAESGLDVIQMHGFREAFKRHYQLGEYFECIDILQDYIENSNVSPIKLKQIKELEDKLLTLELRKAGFSLKDNHRSNGFSER